MHYRWKIVDKEGRMWAGTDATVSLSLPDDAKAKATRKAHKPREDAKEAVADAQKTGGK